MTAGSDFCEEWLKLYRVWEKSDDIEDFLRMKDHEKACDKCRKTEDKHE